MGALTIVKPNEYAKVTDLLDEYFQEVRRYNRALGAFDMSPEMIRDAASREALNYARVQAAKKKLLDRGVAV